jgi:hypothetical protein
MRSHAADRARALCARRAAIGIAPTVLMTMVACAQAVQPWPHGVARPGCTQEDLAAVEVILTQQPWEGTGRPPSPSLRIEVAGTRPGERARIEVATRRPEAGEHVFARAAWVPDDRRVRATWLTGTLQFEQDLPPGLGVTASYRLCADTGECFDGSLSMPWRARRAPCG